MSRRNGDVRLAINGEERTLRLTLGALAEIEAAFGGDFDALQARLKNPRVSDVILILHALLAGGGAPLAIEALKASDLNLADAARAVADCFGALNDGETPGKPRKAGEA